MSKSTNPSYPVRESWRSFPSFLQPFLTWLSGVPLADEIPRVHWTPWRRLTVAIFVFGVGLAVGFIGFAAPLPIAMLLVPISWLILTGATRYFYIVIGHAAAHGTFSPSDRTNRIVAEILSTIFLTVPFDIYRRDHARYHHSKRLGTPFDPDVRFLVRMGFAPGRSRSELWRRLRRTLFSPRYHFRYAADRLRMNLIDAPLPRRIAAAVWIVVGGGIMIATGEILAPALILLPPIVIGFQASALLQFLSEHLWLAVSGSGKVRLGRLTYGRFLGDVYPQHDSLGAKARFWARLIGVHLPARIAVLVGDLPQHDLHHRRVQSDWSNAAFVRRDDVDAGVPGWPEPYFEVWGSLADHIDFLFGHWSAREDLSDNEHDELTRTRAA